MMTAKRAGTLRAAILLACVASACRGNVIQGLGKQIKTEIVAVKQPIVETIAYVGSSQCSNVKQILGIAYEQVEGEKEPDLNALTLQFKTKTFRSIYNITQAARNLPKAFNPKDKLVIFLHGFTDDPSKASFQNISDSFLEKGGYNVIALDGSPLIKWLYLLSTTYIRFMGERLGEVLAAMVKGGLDPADILIVGHSLGSHIASFAGKTFLGITGGKLGRISALDPAGPCFTNVDPELRLKKTDARYVDVIHTDAGVYGLKDAVGHTDYYPNGGSMQPDCLFQTCGHSRAWLLYTESVLNERAFPAVECKDWKTFTMNECGEQDISYMGFPSTPFKTGSYYLTTSGEVPYGLGREGLIYQESNKPVVKKVVNAGENALSGFTNATSRLFG